MSSTDNHHKRERDTFIDQSSPTNYAGMVNKLSTNPKAGAKKVGLLFFPVSNAIPANAVISSARLYLTSQNSRGNHFVEIHRATTSWAEGTSTTSGATWNDPNGTGATGAWATGGFSTADYDTVAYDTLTPSGGNLYVSADISKLLQDWNSAGNKGLVLLPTGTDTGNADWSSRENTNSPSRKPYLQLQYWVPMAGGCNGNTVVGSSADTFINQEKPAENKGTDAKMDTQPAAVGKLRHSLVRFDLSAIPPGAVINSAVLNLTVTDRRNSNHFDQVRILYTDWSETAATWTQRDGLNYWASGGAFGSLDYGTMVYGTIATTSGVKSIMVTDGCKRMGKQWCVQ
ncbi:MAG: DNRLRE domain-containing protein [Anaerolineae bacterium]|nr:DNRLRE domain-containing protein [Anaerolineae bacterium]